MTEALDTSRITIRIVGENFVPIAPYSSVEEAIERGLRNVKPKKATGEQPCIVIPQADAFALQLPDFGEHVYLSIDNAEEHTSLEIFWALTATEEPVIVVQDCASENFERRMVTEESFWQSMPRYGQLVRRFATAAEAHHEHPENIVALTQLHENDMKGRRTVDVHSSHGVHLPSILQGTHPVVSTALGMRGCIPILIGHYMSNNIEGTMEAADLFPGLPRWAHEHKIVWFGYTSRGRLIIVLREADIDRAFIRFYRIEYGFREAKKIVAPAPADD
jgi:hypothetical protein